MCCLDFSVIVLCYNPNYESLIKTIVSIIKQKEVSFEIIICDDGSKIYYESNLNRWFSEHSCNIPIKYVFNQENRGTIINYLSGIQVAEGKYIKPISPGDYLFDSHTLQTYKNEFENYKSDIVFADAIYYSNDTILKKRQYPETRLIFNTDKLQKLYCIYGFYFLGATICATKKILVKYLNIVKGKVLYLEDYSMMTMALLDGVSIKGIERPCVWYEYGDGISTNSKGNKRINDDSEAMRKVLSNLYPANEIVKKMLLFNDIRLKSSVKKCIGYLIHFPQIYYLKICSKTIYKQKQYYISKDEMNKMISLEGIK